MQLELTDQEVANLMQILTNSTGMPWVVTHPLIMKIGEQQQRTQAAAQEAAQAVQRMRGNSHDGSGAGDLDQERGGSERIRPAGRDSPNA